MEKRVSAMTLRKSLGQIMNEVALRGDEVVVERDGKPLVAMIPIEKYERLQESRTAAWDRIFEVIGSIHDRNKDVAPAVLQAEIDEAVEAVKKEERAESRLA